MTKYTNYLLLLVTLFFGSCQSIEQMSISYMVPAAVSFPSALKRVAIINNMPDSPENESIIDENDKKLQPREVMRAINYYNGNPKIAVESLAKALADENYFDEVVICDSVLRAQDITPRETALSLNEINELARNLDVDFLIALENVQIRSIRKLSYSPSWGAFLGTVDAKVFPTVRVYLPNRSAPMVTVNVNDSVYWEEIHPSEAYVRSRLIKEADVIKQASDFAGSIPVKFMLPYWQEDARYLFKGGSVNMRDANVYVKNDNWEKAISLWKDTYAKKKGKKQMYAAHNLAVAYEMQDSLETAENWETIAQNLALAIDKVEERKTMPLLPELIPNYLMVTSYLNKLQIRREGMARLKMQMQRFDDDF